MHTKFTRLVLFLLCLTFTAALPHVATADWGHDPLATSLLGPVGGTTVTDGYGGAILIARNAANTGLYGFHLNSQGEQVWGSAGVPVYTPHNTLSKYEIISDGQGGVYLAITENVSTTKHIWLQHLSASGTLPWGVGGVDCAPNVTTIDLEKPSISITGTGSLIMACEYLYSLNDSDILLQILDSSGNRFLSDNGRFFYNTTDDETVPNIQFDGTSGFYLLSEQQISTEYFIRLNHMDSYGDIDWTSFPAGMEISESYMSSPVMVVNDLGEAIIAWSSSTNYATSGVDIEACRLGMDSTILMYNFTVCSAPNAQSEPQIVPDSNGGSWILWSDYRNYPDTDVYMQHISSDQTLAYPENGTPVGFFNESRSLAHAALTSDGNLAVTWNDHSQYCYDLYCTLLKFPETYIGTSYGRALSTESYPQMENALLPDNDGGMISHFSCYNAVTGTEAHYQRIGRWGFLGDATPAITTVADHPQDQGGIARVTWDSSYLDNYFESGISEYVLFSRCPGAKSSSSASPSGLAALALSTSLPPENLRTLSKDGWTFLETIQPYFLSQYASNAATYGDSTAAGIPYTQYKVLGVCNGIVLESNVLSGYSVDNLSPGAPQALAAEAEDSDAHLQWTPAHYQDEDLLHYNIYRSATSLVEINAGNFLASSTDSTYLDASLPSGTWYYVVTAMDVHGNESDPSNEAVVQEASAAGGSALPQRVAVQGAWPNPFNPSTTIKYAVPEAGRVQLTIFDVRGQAIRTLVAADKQPGYYDVAFDGRDAAGRILASGVYFARLQTADGISTGKLVLTK